MVIFSFYFHFIVGYTEYTCTDIIVLKSPTPTKYTKWLPYVPYKATDDIEEQDKI